MPDYNPKDVPTLDDIIEKDLADRVESDDAENQVPKNDPDLFLDKPIDQNIDGTAIDETGPQTGDLDEGENDVPIIDILPVEPTPQVSPGSIEVGLIVKDIVKQLLPDLEQQLISRLQQALEEKLPEEIIKSADTTHEN